MKEVYKDPTAQRAIGNVTKIEKLRKQHRIREGDVVRMNVEMQQELPTKKTFTKKVDVRIKEIHTHFVTVILPSGLLESFRWWEFEKRRR